MNIEYSVVRSPRRKKLTITVERDRSVIVHAPTGTPDQDVRDIIESKRHWLFEKLHHPQKYRDRPHAPGKEVVSGESAPFLGRDYRVEIGQTRSGQVEFWDRFVIPPIANYLAGVCSESGTSQRRRSRFCLVSHAMPEL